MYFIQVESYTVDCLVSGLFHSVECVQVSSMLCSTCQNFSPFQGGKGVYIFHDMYIPVNSLTRRRTLGCFHFLARLNSAATRVGVHVSEPQLSFLGRYLHADLLNHVGILCLTVSCFPQRLHHFTSPPATHKGSNFSASSPTLVLCLCGNGSHPDGYTPWRLIVVEL